MVDDYLAELAEKYPLGRVGNSEEVAEAIAFLASNKRAGFITGTLLPIEGGATFVV